MKILIIGGTVFLGRHIVESALKNNHEVVLFNRGIHNINLFPNLRKIHGNRDGEISKIGNEKFDVVIDTCGYLPRVVEQSASFLKDKCDKYIFISTVSVYNDYRTVGITEDYSLATLEDENIEEITGETYGPLKALCEKEILHIYKDNSLIIRPGLIAGPNDQSDRFSYWMYRINEGGEVLVPGEKDYPIQFIDVRDLADWIIYSAENNLTGIYNATGPKNILTMEEFVETTKRVLQSNATFTWINDYFLDDENIQAYTQLPLWVPLDTETIGFSQINIEKALNNGLTFRPLETTIQETFEWFDRRPKDYEFLAGLDLQYEKELLEKFKKSLPEEITDNEDD